MGGTKRVVALFHTKDCIVITWGYIGLAKNQQQMRMGIGLGICESTVNV